jgi:flavin reductase (DIM6/NTAB) family NADH-FMN oxidoreductase RutF
MIVSWLTPINNKGNFIASIKKTRFSAELIHQTKSFVLSVPVEGMESLLLKIGKCSGRDVNKILDNKIVTTGFGFTSDPGKGMFGIQGSVAQMFCKVESIQDVEESHHLFYCSIVEAHVNKEYWNGKFEPTSNTLPRYLTFFGAQTFGYVSRN